MALYMDIHKNVKKVNPNELAEAHKKDIEIQGKYGVKFLNYWFSEGDGKVFCLYQAPNREAAAAVHREAHGEVADEIIEVREGK